MFKSYAVLGAGLMGKATAYDLLQQNDTTEVILADNSSEELKKAAEFLNSSKLETRVFDAKNKPEIENLFQNVDAAVAAIHYRFNVLFTKAAIKIKTHLCDLGGNNSIVDEQLKLSQEAEAAGISVIPDCGLAPGMVAIFVRWGIEKFPWADTVNIRVGGLPQNPKNKLKYEKLFSVGGLINEYAEPVRVLRNGKIETIEPLTETEDIQFPGFKNLEAFTTSGGTSTLIETYKNQLKNLDYKTIRYSGHCNEIKELQKNGLFTCEYFEKDLSLCTEDITLVKIVFKGTGQKKEITIADKTKPPFTSMMRMTAFPASIISQMQAREQIKNKGVLPQEKCVPVDLFISELEKREIIIRGINY